MTHYYDAKQTSNLQEQHIVVRSKGEEFPFTTASGIFSKDHLDRATKTLIESFEPQSNEKTLLDLGCGWGVVSVVLKSTYPELEITASDVNERAIAYTKKNAKANKTQIDVIQSDIFASIDDREFDVILTNPPYAAGRAICFAFIEESHKHLKEGGRLLLVARHQKGGKTLREKMETVFGNISTLERSGGFHVYCAEKN